MRLIQELILGMAAAYVTMTPAAGQTFDARTDPVFQKDSASVTSLLLARARLGERFSVVLPTTARMRRMFEIVGGIAKSEFIAATLAKARVYT
jgi:hypothetical protein